jgi:radical SAM superfamily enzyme YgiQ (UPF0313 family)
MKALLIFPRMPLSFFSYAKTVRRLGCRALFPSLSLITVAALLPREWQLRLVDVNVEPVTDQMWAWAELVMISGMVIQRPNMLALIREAKARGKTVVVGGAYPSSMPEEALQAGTDFLIRGEGENTLPLFLAALAQGQTGGVIACTDRPDLTSSPIPRYDLLNLADYANLAIQTSRGCPHNCEFCDVVQLYGRHPRYKEPRQIIAELEAIYRLGWRGQIFVSDDNFIGNKTHARAILRELIPWSKSHGEPFGFITQTTVSLGQDKALMDLMTEANFNEVFLGIESPDDEALARSDKHHNRLAAMEDSIRQIQANGLSIIGSFILGLDGEKPGTGDRIISFIEATNLPFVMVQVLQPVPNTRLWQRLQREGRLLPERNQASSEFDSIGMKPCFLPSRPEAQIIDEYLKVWNTVYEPRRFLERTYRYCLGMRPTRGATARRQGQALPKTAPKAPVPLSQQLRDAYMFLALSWQLGIVSSTRWQFWRQLLGMRRKNPSRLTRYLITCTRGEDVFRLRDLIRQRLTGTQVP